MKRLGKKKKKELVKYKINTICERKEIDFYVAVEWGTWKRSPFFINVRENFTDVLEENFLELIGIK